MDRQTEDQQLRTHLEQLHRELDRSRRLDPETRRLLAEVRDEIEDLLGEDHPPSEEAHSSLIDRLERVTVSAERSNPALAETVNRIAHTLASMGI